MDNYRIIWRPEAVQDVSEHLVFLSKVSVSAAFELRQSLFKEADSLMNFPERNSVFEMGDSFPETLRKRIVNKRYLLIYLIGDQTVEIIRVIDSRKGFEHLI